MSSRQVSRSKEMDSEHDDEEERRGFKAVIDKTWSLIWSDVTAQENDVMQAVVKPQQVSKLGIRMHHSTSGNDVAPGDGLPATYGKVTFTQDLEQQKQKQPARFACMSSDTDPYFVRKLLLDTWKLKPPSVIISVTGSAADFALDSGLEQIVTQGIARAVRATDAWTFTGGTDTGVMKLVAGALAKAKVVTPIIGVAPFQQITDKQRFFDADRDRDRGAHRRHVHYVKRAQNSRASSALDSEHTHFLLVDSGIDSEWASEIEFRGKVEEKISEDLRVPRVLLVIQGGPGTFLTVDDTLADYCHVVLVKESGGCAQAVAEFVEPLLQQKSELLLDPKLLEEKISERLNDADFLVRLKARLRPSAHPRTRPPARPPASGLCTLHGLRTAGPPAASVLAATLYCGSPCHQVLMTTMQLNKVVPMLRNIGNKLQLLHVFTITDMHRMPFDMAMLKAFVSSFKMREHSDAEREQRMFRIKELSTLSPGVPPHQNARRERGGNPLYLGKRIAVSDKQVPWSFAWPDYNPSEFNAPVIINNSALLSTGHKWADPGELQGPAVKKGFSNLLAEVRERTTYIGGPRGAKLATAISFDAADGMPLNPRGRTGLSGRGLLGKWGPNHAADPIVTRYHPQTNKLQFVALRREDTGQFAVPGGIANSPGDKWNDKVSSTFRMEVSELEGDDLVQQQYMNLLLDDLFQGEDSSVVYRGCE